MDFGEALKALKEGKKVSRKGWNGNATVIVPSLPYRPTTLPERTCYDEACDLTFIQLSTGKIAVADGCMYERLAQYKWCEDSKGYAYRSDYPDGAESKRTLKMHTFLLGDIPEGYVVDHINGDILDNRLCNLRIATPSQNCANSRSKTGSTSKYKGVSWDSSRSKWISSIQYDGKTHHLGRYDSEEECARAYDKKALEVYGEFAKLNFPEEHPRERMYLYLTPGHKLSAQEWTAKDSAHEMTDHERLTGEVEILPHIDMYTVNKSGRRGRLCGWLASQTDMLSEDWVIVE